MNRPCVVCTTCQARLRVKNLASLGQIVACPRCGSMVLVNVPHELIPVEPPPPPQGGALLSLTGVPSMDDQESSDGWSDPELDTGGGVSEVPAKLGITGRMRWGFGLGAVALTGSAILYVAVAGSGPRRAGPVASPVTDAQMAVPQVSTEVQPSTLDDGVASPNTETLADPHSDATSSGPVAQQSELARQDAAAQAQLTQDPNAADPNSVDPSSTARDPVPADEVGGGDPSGVEQGGTEEAGPVPGRPPDVAADAPVATPGVAAVAGGTGTASDPPSSTAQLGRYVDLLSGVAPGSAPAGGAPSDTRVESDAHAPPSMDTGSQSERRLAKEKIQRQTLTRRMSLELVEFDASKQVLIQTLNVIARLAQTEVQVDPDGLPAIGSLLQQSTNFVGQQKTLDQLLRELLAPHQLEYSIEPGFLHIHAMAGNNLGFKRVEYPLEGLARTDEDATWIHAQMRQFVAPASWGAPDESAHSEFKEQRVSVDQTREVHGQIADFLDGLRVRRGLVAADSEVAQRHPNGGPYVHAERTWLQQPVELTVRSPAKLVDLLNRLGTHAKVAVLFDWTHLVGRPEMSELTSLPATRIPLATAFESSLPAGITYRVVGTQVVQITSVELLEKRGETVMYHLPAEMRSWTAEQIQKELAQWVQASTAANAEPLVAVADPQYPVLLVRAPQRIHRLVFERLKGNSVAPSDPSLSISAKN